MIILNDRVLMGQKTRSTIVTIFGGTSAAFGASINSI